MAMVKPQFLGRGTKWLDEFLTMPECQKPVRLQVVGKLLPSFTKWQETVPDRTNLIG